jgi:hypothetical protein
LMKVIYYDEKLGDIFPQKTEPFKISIYGGKYYFWKMF